VHLLEEDLHKTESIALAVETRPKTEARRIAGLSDLPVTGIIGLLMQARCRSPRWVRRWKG
jgi:predicted nucleic acid-binding protein